MSEKVIRWLAHIRALAVDIGPRGSTTDAERRGAEYCEAVLHRAGLQPKIETFSSARSIFQPHLVAAAALLAAFVVYPLGGRGGALLAGISFVALASDLLELSFIHNPLRLVVAKGASQNVVAVAPPASDHRQDLVLIGHIDTQRTPLVFSTSGWLAAYKVFTFVAFLLFISQVGLYLVGVWAQWPWIWLATAPSAVAATLLIALCLEAERAPFTAGANDNASGVGLLLTLAEDLAEHPLQKTRVWLVCTGCEEVQHYGAVDFFRRHQCELRRPVALAFEMLGCAAPGWLTREGIIIPFRADSRLISLAESVASRHPELGAAATQISGGNTEMADAMRLGIPALTVCGCMSASDVIYWHQVGDTFDKIDPQMLARAYAFTSSLLIAIDEGAGTG